jgi:vancomycin permeability regulator SanA
MNRPTQKYVASRGRPEPGPKLGPRRWAYHQPVRARSTAAVVLSRIAYLAILGAALFAIFAIGFKLWVDIRANGLIYEHTSARLPSRHVALVLGAGLNPEGKPSAFLYDRVATAADLYKAGKVKKLLMSGDNGDVYYNEVEAMRVSAIELGVPDADIVLDYAGFNTWDSCFRARDVFSQRDVIIVTQKFHLPRALYACRHLGVSAVGVMADRQPYPTMANELREFPALVGLALRVIVNDQPRFLGPKVDVDQPQER